MIRTQFLIPAAISAAVFSASASAIDIEIDYSFDSNGFFDTGTADGVQARAAMEAAASQLSAILDDTFVSIETPPVFVGAAGQVEWIWSQEIINPSTGLSASISNPTVAEDAYVIYAGGRSLPGNTLGRGGPGGFRSTIATTGLFSPGEIAQIESINDDFSGSIRTRGEASGYAGWGGVVTFDSDASTTWNFDHTTAPSTGESDFFSVALHELIHTLGFGTVDEWDALISGSVFTGAASVAEFGGNVPLAPAPDLAHWAAGTPSTVFGGGAVQETLMDPDILIGTRKLLTDLDAAGLTDLGWTVIPEPTSLMLLGGAAVLLIRRRRAA